MTRHVDTNDYGWDRRRVHVPITTSPDVTCQCGDATAHMAPREAWVFDTWRRHRVRNRAAARRVHPVVDPVGRETFWPLVDHADRQPRFVAFDPGTRPSFDVETTNHAVVMTSSELGRLLDAVASELRDGPVPSGAGLVDVDLRPFRRAWSATWASWGDGGWDEYERLPMRETVFDGLPLTATEHERVCGGWVVDIERCEQVAFFRFEGVVQEIFGVVVLAGIPFPELVEPDADVVSGAFVLAAPR